MTPRINATRAIALLIALLATTAVGAPRVPDSDSEVLERLPTESGLASPRSARALNALVAREPENLDLAVRLAQIQVARAHTDSDPRQLGHAQAALAPWWNQAEPPVPVLLLRATIRQSIHEFPSALADLEQVVARDPSNTQAWLTRATVQQVTGDITGATESCCRLGALGEGLVADACKASVDGASGKADAAYASLDRALNPPTSVTNESIGVRAWAITMQAEIAERLGRRDDAERLYRNSLLLDPRDAYVIAAYADFLIDADRADEVLALIATDTAVDNLLLRYAIAAARTRDATAAASSADLASRYAASRERGDRVHLREQARFALAIKKSPTQALQLALDNWAMQKEPIDARIVLEAALAAKRPREAAAVIDWLRATGLEDVRLTPLAAQVATP